MAIGKKTGGRKKGKLNRQTVDLQALLDHMGCDPRQTMALIVENKLPCGVCRGEGRTPFKLPDGKHAAECVGGSRCVCEGISERPCQSCLGTLMESCSPALRGSMAGELLQYLLPKRKAVEHSGPEGGPIEHKHEIVLVE